MNEIDMEKVMTKVGNNAHKLVILVSKRVRQLNEGSPKLIETNSKKPATIALEEIAAGKIGCKERQLKEKQL